MASPLRILACSDLHGLHSGMIASTMDELRPDWIVVVGDVLPDFPRIAGQHSRLEAQKEFWRVYRRTFLRDGARTTLVLGNHEIEGFSDPELRRSPNGLEGRVVRLEGLPAEFGHCGRGWEAEELERELRDQLRVVPEPLIYLSHVPPFGCLDVTKGGEHVGHHALARHLEARGWPKTLVVCGHVREGFGCTDRGQTLILNVAGGFALVQWSPDESRILDLEQE